VFYPNNEEQKSDDRHCWRCKRDKAPYMAESWASGGYFPGIDPRKKGLKGVVLGLFLQTKGGFEEQKLGGQ
jgi:hypothetical protein